MGLGISPLLCDHYLLYYELEWCQSICTKIRDLVPGALFLLPALLTMTRYLDDIMRFFPLEKAGPQALKQSNGGPYPDTIGIKSEHRGRKVPFLDTLIS